VKLVLVDDHTLFREAFQTLLKLSDPKLDVAGEAPDARSAVSLAQSLQPDLIVMDVLLQGTNGIAATRELRRIGFTRPILVLTAAREVPFVVDAFAAGAQGYALKEQCITEVLAAIHTVSAGGRYLAPRLETSLPDAAAQHGNGVPGVIDALSAREREIFNLVIAGYSNQGMATELFISIKTVETHRSRINKKLRVHSTAELIRLAALHGLVSS
jgi:two-component system response regulator NreC